MEITKASGDRELFSREKFCRSLKKAGAPSHVITKVCEKIESELKPAMSTLELSQKATRHLERESLLIAAKYNLKNAIMQLGPAGFLFEDYVAAILREYGYRTKVGQMVRGKCVSHEIDIMAQKEGRHYMVEVKYHNRRGIKSDVQVAMYMYARFLDIKQAHEEFESPTSIHKAWLITNTKFTSKAIRYAGCMGVQMTGWRHPQGESLEDLIIEKGLYPVTVLPSMNKLALECFASEHVMFARDLLVYSAEDLTKRFGLYPKTAKQLMKEVYDLV